MQTKDFIYAGLIALAGAIFYFHGYLSGTRKARQPRPGEKEQADLPCEAPNAVTTSVPLFFFRGETTLLKTQGCGVFGKN